MLNVDPKTETQKITGFIQNVLKKNGKNKVIIGLSGGIDSATSFYLLKKTLSLQNIIVVHLPYREEKDKNLDNIVGDLPKKNIRILSIKESVDKIAETLGIRHSGPSVMSSGSNDLSRIDSGVASTPQNDKIRLGNIIARIRMVMLFDLAKKHNALVCGTENKSEHYLGYFTRFGDEASDFEPIRHLYKTQVYKLAEYLGVPKEIIEKKPTAGLWTGQTDEKELGFSYEEADPILYLYFEKKLKVDEIKKRGLKNTNKVISWSLKNKFKNETPYSL